MKNLVIHTKDNTTDFLKPIYKNLNNVTFIDGDISKSEIKNLVNCHNRTIFLGHGTSRGLSSLNKYNYKGEYIIDYTFKKYLINNHDNIYLWCDADKFVKNNELSGLHIGMFISDIEESKKYGIDDVKEFEIVQSNFYFSKILSECIQKSTSDIYKILIQKYSKYSKKNRIAAFNVERIYYK